MEENQAEEGNKGGGGEGRRGRGEEGREVEEGEGGEGQREKGGSFTVTASHSISLSNATNSTHPL